MDSQSPYWDSVAHSKEFTHPVNLDLLSQHLTPDSLIIDYGCGYGRTVAQLHAAGYLRTQGYDTSLQLVRRGLNAGVHNLHHLPSPGDLPLPDGSVDCFLLIAVLTCIPTNVHQLALIEMLGRKLSRGGLLLISDYYLQPSGLASGRYFSLDGNPANFGVFTLPEGVTLRHHPREWVQQLLQTFTPLSEEKVEVRTMNGNLAEGFQVLLRKERR